jgi:hypothetical protein
MGCRDDSARIRPARRRRRSAPPRRGRVLLVIPRRWARAWCGRAPALAAGEFAAFAADVGRTQAALLEAASAVDPATDGPLAARIDELHDAMVGNLALANRERTLERLDEVLAAFAPLLHDCRAVPADPPA